MGTQKAVNAALLTDAAIEALSGPKVFERGFTYAASGSVRVIGEEPDSGAHIRAHVVGTQTYETEVGLEDGDIHGYCNCPHGASGWFCKHQVALCLVWRDWLNGSPPVVDEGARRKVQAAARRAQTQRDQRAALHAFLKAQPASALAERLIDLAENFSEIERELRAWQKATRAVTTPEELRALVSEVLTIRGGLLPWGQVPAWLRQAEVILPLLSRARERDAATARDIALHALRRGWAALQKADDSSGLIGGLCQAIAAEWVACLEASAPQPAKFGETWLRIQLEDPFGCVPAQQVEEIMGASALERYRSVLAAEWQKLHEARDAKPAGRRAAPNPFLDEAGIRARSIENLHVEALQNAGDIDGALAVLRADLSEPHRCREVTHFLESHGRLREAFASAEDAHRRFPGDWQVEEDLLRAYERDGWVKEAHAMRMRQFEARPDAQRYLQALKSGIEAGLDREALRGQMFQYMEQLEVQQMRAPSPRMARPAERELAGRRNVSLRVQVLLAEQCLEEALQLVQPPAICHADLLREIALKLGKDKRKAAIELLLHVFGLAMRSAQTPYRNELALVWEIAERMDSRNRASWLAQLRVEYKAKRNFVRDLPVE